MEHHGYADLLTQHSPCFNGDRSKGDMRALYIWLICCTSLPGEEDNYKGDMSLPGVEGNNKGGISQEDGQDDHDLDDVHEVVAHCQACRQGDEGVLGVYLAGTLCILLGLEICLHTNPGCSSCPACCHL